MNSSFLYILFILFMLIVLTIYVLPVYGASFEVDVRTSVYRVVDGDAFDAFPIGRVRVHLFICFYMSVHRFILVPPAVGWVSSFIAGVFTADPGRRHICI